MKKFGLILICTCVVFAFSVTDSQAQADIGFKGIGGRLSFVKPENVDGTIGFGAQANLGEVVENLVLYPSVEFWTKSEGPSDFSQFALNADARYYFPSSSNLSLFAGGGLALLFNSADVDLGGFGSGDASSTDIGLNLLGGLDIPVSEKLTFSGTGKFVISDGSVLKITAGLTYSLGE